MFVIRISLLALFVILLALPVTAFSGTVVRMQTSLGVIDIDLYDEGAPEGAPLTVENFLHYVNAGDYDNSFFHRSADILIQGVYAGEFIIQGGGFSWGDDDRYYNVPQNDPVINEFSLNRSNVRGTIAMAKLGGDPDSATNQWFFNLSDNSANLDNQNGGFTVFGQIKESGYAVMDAIGALQTVNAGGAFETLPLISFPQDQILRGENLVMVNSVKVLPTVTASDSDRIFNYLEATYQQYVSPASQPSTNAYGYYFRYYPGTKAYVGTANGTVYYLLDGDEVRELGSVSSWLRTATAAGY